MLTLLSCRSIYLDVFLQRFLSNSSGKLLDLGGKRFRRRGKFDLSSLGFDLTVINPDILALPDYVGYLSDFLIPESYIDNVLCTEVLEYCSSPSELIADIKTVLKPGGFLFLSVPFLHKVHGDHRDDRFRFTPSCLEHLCSGFRDVKIYPMGGLISVTADFIISSTKIPVSLRLLLSKLMSLYIRHESSSMTCTTGYFVVARL